MPVRAIRGAIQVEADNPRAILSATRTLLLAILQLNPGLRSEDLASVIFTTTPDLCSAYPAEAARQLGWSEVALMCAQEIAVPDGLPRVIRLLAHWNTKKPQACVQHAYLGAAAALRPDRSAHTAVLPRLNPTPLDETDASGPRVPLRPPPPESRPA